MKFTFFSKEKECLFADAAGVGLRIKIWSGETMERFSINTAKSFLGKNVNVHLKDGSVIVNVLFSEILKDDFGRKTFVKCVPYRKENEFKIPLKSIAWAELLNLNLIFINANN